MRHAVYLLALFLLPLAACSSTGDGGNPVSTGATDSSATAPTQDAATRSTPVVMGRPARVFVFASFGKSCEPVAAPTLTVTAPPTKGEITMTPGQETTIQYSLSGNCIGQKATGTGVYYTPKAGSSGTDRFTIEAKLASGEVATRKFEVNIVE